MQPVSAPLILQLATRVVVPPAGDAWLHEIKHDGFRMMVSRQGEKANVFSRTGLTWTAKLPLMAAAALKLKAKSCVIDGEAVVQSASGASSFGRMQDAIARKDDRNVLLMAFDLLQLDGEDLRKLPLIERKGRLERLLKASKQSRFQYCEHLEGDGAEILRHAAALGCEGIVSKRRNSIYKGGRSDDWLKTKALQRQAFVIVGYWDRSNGRADFGALALGAYEKGQLVYVGNVGTGWSARTRADLYNDLTKLRLKAATLKLPRAVPTSGLNFVKPQRVCEVAFSEWTADQILRHPSFKGLRTDKGARDVTIDRPARQPLKVHSHWFR